MRNLVFALAPLLGGCIYYENNSGWDDDCDGACDWWDDDGDGIVDDDEDPDVDDTDAVDETPAFSLAITPSSIAQGETDVASLVAEGEFDLGTVAAVTVLGPVAVLEVLPRDNALLLVLEADLAAEVGPYHMLLDLEDGSTVFMDDALTVTLAPADDGSGDGGCAD